MTRITRAESQARTRELLIATARELLLRDGYHATTLEKVADAAGFSKGAVYSNFATKDELCQVVIDAVRGEQTRAILGVFSGEGTVEDRIAVFEAWAEATIGDRGWTLLEAEFAIHAVRRDPELLARVVAGGKIAEDGLRLLVEDELRQRPRELPLPPGEVVEAVLSLGIGLGLRRAIDPEVSPRSLADTVRVLLGVPPPSAG